MRAHVVIVAVMLIGGLADARRRPVQVVQPEVADDGDLHVVSYCVAAPEEGACPAAVDPPWRPTYVRRGSGKVTHDEDLSTAHAACCYRTTWGEEPERAVKNPGCKDGSPDCCNGRACGHGLDDRVP